MINTEIKTQQNYEKFIRGIMKRCGIIKTEQLYLCIQNAFDVSKKEAHNIVFDAQKHGYVLRSTDGYALTKGMYRYITEINADPDTAYANVDFEDEYPVYEISMFTKFMNRDVIDAMWIIADRMPDSYDFVLRPGLFTAQFIAESPDSGTTCVYQIMSFPRKDADAKITLLRYAEDEKDMAQWLRDNRDIIRRIGIVEDETYLKKFKNAGLTNLVVIDEDDPYGYRLVDDNE